MHISSFVFSSVIVLISYYAEKYRQIDLQNTLEELEDDLGFPVTQNYDFIIVGAGAAGAVVANRLSEHFHVLLLEAGGTPPPASLVPVFTSLLEKVPEVHYSFTSVPQLNASLSTGGVVTRKPAKMLGGSTSHYGGGYNRGSPMDFDNWATITNDSSWKYENLLKYFKFSEKYIGHMYKGDQHSTHGLMTDDDGLAPYTSLWFDAGNELGFVSADPNGPQIESFTTMAIYKENGRRVTTYTSFLEPIEKQRNNLKIIRYAVASQVMIDEVTKKAYGVKYYRHGIAQMAEASKEVIVCAGAFASPLLLLKSGIGPKPLLNQAKIPVVVDLPVGIGLHDHPAFNLGPFYIKDTTLFPSLTTNWTKDSIDNYLNHNGAGILRGITATQAFYVSSRAKDQGEHNWPDLQLVFKSDFYDVKPRTERIVSLDIVLGRPKSRSGYISFNSGVYLAGERDDEKLALIDYKLLEDPSDFDVMIEGIQLAFKIMENTTAFQKIGTTFSGKVNENCTQYEFRSNNYWKCVLHQLGVPWFHLAGSCRMGNEFEDPNAVVDSKLRVIGVQNLRVIDGSIMPVAPNANTAAPVIMIGEKGSAMILETWNPKLSKVQGVI